MSSAFVISFTLVKIFLCVKGTDLDLPVVPLVNISTAASSGLQRLGSISIGSIPVMNCSRGLSFSMSHTRCAGILLSSFNKVFFIFSERNKNFACVFSISFLSSFSVLLKGTGATTAPRFRAARNAIPHSGQFSEQIRILSWGPTPCFFK